MFPRYWIAASLLLAAASAAIFSCKGSDGAVVARAGSVRITQQDLTKELANSPPAYQNYLSTIEGKRQFVDILLREKILLNAAEKSGLARRKEVQKNLEEYRRRAKEEEREFRKNLILREYLRDLKDKELKVSEDEIKKYYEDRQDEFKNPVRIAASHILSPTQEQAEAALARVKKGEDFARVAREVSTDPSAARGGAIGEVARGDLAELPEFEKELFSLKSGQVSGVVKTKIGYHVIKKTGEMRMAPQTYEQAGPQIHRILEKEKFDAWIEKQKKDQKVTIDDTVLAKIPVPRTGGLEEGLPKGASTSSADAPTSSVDKPAPSAK